MTQKQRFGREDKETISVERSMLSLCIRPALRKARIPVNYHVSFLILAARGKVDQQQCSAARISERGI